MGLTVDPCGLGERGARPAGDLTDGPKLWRADLLAAGDGLLPAWGAGDVEGLGLDILFNDLVDY